MLPPALFCGAGSRRTELSRSCQAGDCHDGARRVPEPPSPDAAAFATTWPDASSATAAASKEASRPC